MYSRVIAALARRGSSGGQMAIRQPRFTPATRPIAEEGVISSEREVANRARNMLTTEGRREAPPGAELAAQ